ncbi:MAG TPA: DEAD/DEAH box helicase [Pseudonocardiaceae bacterium]|jgi:superfamily II DNA or RNA helicase|nr:DEAD/DEAH box helicase [Pseudonocardiaceae bacterium]
MQLVVVEGVDPAGIERAVGNGSYVKGAQYAQQRRVVHMEWDDAETALQGTVRGSGGRLYTSVVYFSTRNGSDLEFEFGECSCPVGFGCKHAVALALTAAGAASPRTGASPPRPAEAWERSLGSLFERGRDGVEGHPGGVALGIELTLSGAPGSVSVPGAGPKLLARLVQPGKTGWVGGGLSWSMLGSLRHYGDYRASHVRLLHELYALYQARVNPVSYYSYRTDKTIDLATFGRQLWPLLDEAASIGVQTVHARKGLGAVERYGHAELCLDVTGGQRAGSLAVTPVLRLEGTGLDGTGVDGTGMAAVPIGFLGAEGHGVVHVPAAEAPGGVDPGGRRFRLARLARPVPPPLQRMALEGQRLEIPAGEQARFRDEYYPRLRHLAVVVSSDQSFTPPAISDPTLVLHASYGTGHDLGVSWEWAYEVGDAQVRAPLAPSGADSTVDGYRDPAKERAVLDALDVPLDRFRLRGEDLEQGLVPRADLDGLDTMRFTTEVLPLLADAPGVAVEISGEPADYREAGDSLRIGVSTDDVAGETDWFDLGVSITVEGREVPFTDVFVALAADESHLLLADGAYFSLQKPELQALRGLIEEARALQDAPDGPLRISRFQAGLWDELTELGVVDRQAKAWQQQVAGLLALGSVPATEPPASLSARLRPYQRDGFGWLAFIWEFRLGGILADDMGLGKTVQSLALICHAKQAEPASSPFLIVAPTSVVSNWPAEAARFAPDLTVVPISDTLRRRGQDLDEIIAGADVVVTSYTLFRLDYDAYAATDWSGLILDEAQYTKNHQSKIHQCARRLAAPFKLAITGTPMENNLMELWSLLSIAAPGLFPSPTRFRDHYARPIERQADAERLGQLRRRIKPLMKRRTKELVAADLPPKQEQVLEVELDPRHRRIYQRHLQRERQKVLGLLDDVNRNRFTILRSLTLLRQLSLHSGLVDAEHRDLPSSKVDALLDQLPDVIDGGHRALVFSQFTRFLTHVRERLDAAGIAYCYLDGRTRNRAAVVQRFKDGAAPVFLISLKAGGFGLNLTEADYCFLLDPWWNPATEVQAVDRTHRIGQSRNVMVYRLISKDTIEEKVMALQARKAELFAGVMDDGNVFGSSLDADDIRALLA